MPGRTDWVVLTEGEKDADAGAKVGLPTTTSGGVSSFREDHADALRGKNVVIVADADDPGRVHAQKAATMLYGRATSVKVCEIPGFKDLAASIEKGVSADVLCALFEDAPEWKPAEGCEILDSLLRFVRRFVSLTDSQARAVALWAAHTHARDATDFTPYLSITSAEKESGKTRVLEVLRFLVSEPWFTGRVSAAVLVRKIDAEQPTLLLDESDAAFGSEREYAEALRGVLNTGYQRGGVSSCCVGQGANISCKDFSTFCAKAIAGIGKLPDTVASRSIPIRLQRAQRGTVSKLRQRDGERETAELRVALAAWCGANLDRLRSARPEIPERLSDRQADCCEPLLAIADLAGADWPDIARRALVELCCAAQEADQSIGIRLLADIRAIFLERGVDRISSADLVEALAEIETSPWSEWSKGKPITKPKLAHLLNKFGITPSTVRFPNGKVAKGYYRADCTDAWGLYLPQDTTPTLHGDASKRSSVTTRANTGENTNFENGTPSSCNGRENMQIASKDALCNGVTVSRALPAHKGVEEDL